MKTLSIWLLLFTSAVAEEVKKISVAPPSHMTRADIWVVLPSANPQAVLVLCPGRNGSAENLVRDQVWQTFARQNNLALFGLSFASLKTDLSRGYGYTFPDQGSGNILLQAVRQETGKDLPLLLYGFSSGGYFTELFVEWQPEKVLAWCSHAVGYTTKAAVAWPPGIVSCGEQDHQRYANDLMHFKMGRAAGAKLLWIGFPECGHEWPKKLHHFTQAYFSAILDSAKTGLWIDIGTENTLSHAQALRQPSLSAWIPKESLKDSWKNIHQP